MAFIAALAAADVLPVHGQAPVTLEHRATFPESFGLLQAVRPLPDGRLLVADPLGGILVALEMETGRMDPVGREGGGPGEWRQPDAVFPLPGDSTLLVDLGNARLSVLDAGGSFTQDHPMVLAMDAAATEAGVTGRPPGIGSVEIVQPRATDGAGNIYYQSRGLGAPGSAPDSSEIRRWARGEREPVAVARLRPPALSSSTAGGVSQMQVRMRPIPLAPQDDWTVAPDGRVAVVRADPYRVEWVNTDGQVVRGEVVDYRPVPVREADKERWIEGLSSTGLAVTMTSDGGGASTQFRRGGGMMPGAAMGGVDDYDWPAVLPAFRTGGARVDPTGRLWVERYQGVGAPALYDVFDRRGARVGQVTLPPDHRVLGFSQDAVYAVRVDDLGLNWLEVFAPPSGGPTRR